tara:strand:+ start:7501 stop:8637 length:1137 start_codon:yes stop_codon:yes gene_type:complete
VKKVLTLSLCVVVYYLLSSFPNSDAQVLSTPGVISTADELQRLNQLTQINDSETHRLLSHFYNSEYADVNRPYTPYAVVNIAARESTAMEKQFKDDAHAARAMAILWHITYDDKYMLKAIEIIRGWSAKFEGFNVTKGHKRQAYLEAAWVTPVWISAADAVAMGGQNNAWTNTDKEMFKHFILKLQDYFEKAYRDNNWGASATLAQIATAVYLNDSKLYQQQLEKFNYYLKTLTNSDGSMNADYLSDPWHPQYTLIAMIQVAEIAFNQGDDLYGTTFGKETLPRLALVLEHMASLFLGERPNPDGLKKGNYKGAHNNKQGYQIAYNHYFNKRQMKREQLPLFAKLVDKWAVNETSPLFMKWDRITHDQTVTSAHEDKP